MVAGEDFDPDSPPESRLRSGAEAFAWRDDRLASLGRIVSPGFYGFMPVATVGDVNADGCGDLMLLGTNDVTGNSYRPDASLYLGGSTGIPSIANWTAGDGKRSIDEPIVALGLGSLGQGRLGDVLIAANNVSEGHGVHQLFVFAGDPTGLGYRPAWIVDADAMRVIERPFDLDVLLPKVGDVNGDGIADIFLPDGLYLGSRGVPPGPFDGARPVWSLDGNTPAAVADVDRDGCDDFIVLTDDAATLYSGGSPPAD